MTLYLIFLLVSLRAQICVFECSINLPEQSRIGLHRENRPAAIDGQGSFNVKFLHWLVLDKTFA